MALRSTNSIMLDDEGPLFEVKKWPDFLKWFLSQWEQGQHVALVGPTGEGKTTFILTILPNRRYVMALDPKGGDSTLAKLEGKHRFERSVWPPKRRWFRDDMWKRIERGEPVRLIIGNPVKTMDDFPALATMLRNAIRDSFANRGWTVYIDELQLAADRRLMNLGRWIELNLIAARDRKVSMVMSFQRPANVPRAASEMSTWLIVFYTRDRDTVNRLAEMTGRPAEEIRGMVRGLPSHTVLVFNRSPRVPVVITRAEV